MLTISQIVDGLNDSQKLAVTTTDVPLLIVAGPGSGKTLTIVRRIAYLIHQGIKPENILAVTFTNRAAQEMRERTEVLLGKNISGVFIGTFHALGLNMLGMHPDSFVIYNREDQINLLKTVIKNADFKNICKGSSYHQVAERISRIKNFMENIDDGGRVIYEKYQTALKENNAFDFDDLIIKPIEMLSDSAEMLERYRNNYRYIMVDEYQDINTAQYKLLTLLAHENVNLCAIGDSDQAIYAFRGANVDNFLNFEKDFKNAKTITLTENYRSKGVILNASNSLIKNNVKRIEKELKTIREKGIPVTVISVPDERAEGEIIVKEIEERIGGTSHFQLMKKGISADKHLEDSYSFSDFAVMFRTNVQAKAIEEAFKISGIPYQLIGEKYSFRKKDMLNILSLLKFLVNPLDNLNFRKASSLLSEKLDEAFLKKTENLKNTLPIREFLNLVWEESGIKNCCDENNFMFLMDLADQYQSMKPEQVMDSFINEVSLLTPSDDFDPRADAVPLMTLHMAKGLEFRVVFIVGVEDGLIPYTMKKDDVDVEEERRLFYVGMTRAMDELFLIHARKRYLYGQRLNQSPSPFLKEIPEEFIESRFVPDRIKKEKKDNQIGLF